MMTPWKEASRWIMQCSFSTERACSLTCDNPFFLDAYDPSAYSWGGWTGACPV